jgi:hypothetical protein
MADEQDVISGENSFLGENIKISDYAPEVQEKIKQLQAGYTKRRQKETEEIKKMKEEMEILNEIKSEYDELMNYQPFIDWAVEHREEMTGGEEEIEGGEEEEGEEEVTQKREFRKMTERMDEIEFEIRKKEIENELVVIEEYAKKNNLPSLEDVYPSMLKISEFKAKTSKSGRCELSPEELYFLAIKEELPNLIKNKKIPFFETSSGGEEGGSEKQEDFFDRVLKAKRSI